MKRATYVIKKQQPGKFKGPFGKNDVNEIITQKDILNSLRKISFEEGEQKFSFPGNYTRVNVSENEENIILGVETAHRRRVEKTLRKFLDNLNAEWNSGSEKMRWQDYHSYSNEDNFCFIATEVYGDINAPQVQVLRGFRDNTLSRYHLGRKFTEWYYGGAGQEIAHTIGKSPRIKSAIRAGLDCFVSHLG
jgi:hypothetical protein